MDYKRLPYEEYFINTSEDYTHTGRVTYPMHYHIHYDRPELYRKYAGNDPQIPDNKVRTV